MYSQNVLRWPHAFCCFVTCKGLAEMNIGGLCVGLGRDGVSVSGNGRQQKMKYKMFVPRVRKARRR
jgi:hypothetical protein